MRETIVGVMGPGKGASSEVLSLAEELGSLIAQNGWTLLTGGPSPNMTVSSDEQVVGLRLDKDQSVAKIMDSTPSQRQS
jgi:predicted Rossmann-fold nucleotide-binding protein